MGKALTVAVDRSQLMSGRRGPVLVGRVVRTDQPVVPYLLLDAVGNPVDPVSEWTTEGTGVRQVAPLSPDASLWLARYVAGRGSTDPHAMVWRTLRGQDRPLTYSAVRRRVLQRANEKLGTNWTLHDLGTPPVSGWPTTPLGLFRWALRFQAAGTV